MAETARARTAIENPAWSCPLRSRPNRSLVAWRTSSTSLTRLPKTDLSTPTVGLRFAGTKGGCIFEAQLV